MNAPNAGTKLSREIRAEASAWIAKLHGPERSAELEEDFRSWLSASTENARAFEHMTEIWESIAQVNVGGMPRLTVSEPRDPLSVPKRRLYLRLAAACVLVVALGIAWFVTIDGSYSTGIGEQRIVNLDDGSRIHLNSATTIDVDIGRTARRLRLERGEAFFEVAKDPARPFVVAVGERVVTALGTSFVVRFDPDRLAVTLVEGSVAVSERGAATAPESLKASISSKDDHVSAQTPEHGTGNAGDVLILKAGERVTFPEGGSATIDLPRADATAAWRRGEVVLNDTPLSAAVVEMNRYQRQPIVIEGAIGHLPISGIYRAGSNEDFANAVAIVYGLEVIREGREIHLRAKR